MRHSYIILIASLISLLALSCEQVDTEVCDCPQNATELFPISFDYENAQLLEDMIITLTPECTNDKGEYIWQYYKSHEILSPGNIESGYLAYISFWRTEDAEPNFTYHPTYISLEHNGTIELSADYPWVKTHNSVGPYICTDYYGCLPEDEGDYWHNYRLPIVVEELGSYRFRVYYYHSCTKSTFVTKWITVEFHPARTSDTVNGNEGTVSIKVSNFI